MAADIKIEKGIPVPMRRKYPFAMMEVGDSFFVPAMKATKVRCAAIMWAKYNKSAAKFAIRTVDGGARCWRIA